LLYVESVFRASDHNPIVVGLEVVSDETPTEPIAEWQRGEVYGEGDAVTYHGATYVAQWWTTEKPGTSPWGSWMEQGEKLVCEAGEVTEWTQSQVYTGGELVGYKGQVYEAQWWSRNEVPKKPHGAWASLGSC